MGDAISPPVEDLTAYLLGAIAVCAGVFTRITFWRSRKHDAVDQFYWTQAADTFRTRRRIPINLGDRYLLEDSRQFYPPGFAVFLSLFKPSFLRSHRSVVVPQALDLVLAVLVGTFTAALGSPVSVSFLSGALILCSPTLSAYNFQLASRGLGNLFASLTLVLQVVAMEKLDSFRSWIWLLSFVAAGLTILTHKMSTQLLFAVEVAAAIFIGSGNEKLYLALTPLAGAAVAAVITGPSFQIQQWRAHADVVAFWGRNWRFLGAHQVLNSELYGNESIVLPGRFHIAGLKGALEKTLRIVAHLPVACPCLLAVLLHGSQYELLTVWVAVGMSLAGLTSFVDQLKRFGAGHLYMFGLVVPTSLLCAFTFDSNGILGGALCAFAIGSTSVIALVENSRKSVRRTTSEIDELLSYLSGFKELRVAVLPCTVAERIAGTLGNSVLWGGHSLGFRDLESFWPVLREPIDVIMRRHEIGILVWDRSWLAEPGETWFSHLSNLSCTSCRVGQWEVRHFSFQKSP